MIKAVIYARYSPGPEQTAQSIEGQLRTCKKFIKDNGWVFTHLYADEHLTGRNDKRPAFQEMIRDAEDHKFNVLVVYSTDRFSRDKYDSVFYKKKLKDAGVQIEYAAENIPKGPEGILLESLMEGWAQYYSEELSRKVKRGMHESALKAQATGGGPVFGYTKGPDKTYIIVEKEAEAIKHIFDMVANGKTITDAVKYLKAEGLKNYFGRDINGQMVKRILTNEKYTGLYKFADVIVEGGMPQIVDKETFKKVQGIVAMNSKTRNRHNYLLSGKAFCGECGRQLAGVSGTSKTGAVHYYYKCKKNNDIEPIPAGLLEGIVAEETRRLFSSPLELESLVDKLYAYQGKKKPIEAKISSLKSNFSKLKMKRERLLDLIADTGDKRLLKKLDDIDKELEEVEEAIKEERKNNNVFFLTKEQIEYSLKKFFNGWNFDSEDTTNARVLKALVKRVDLYHDRIVITYNINGSNGDPKLTEGFEFDQIPNWWVSESLVEPLTFQHTIIHHKNKA